MNKKPSYCFSFLPAFGQKGAQIHQIHLCFYKHTHTAAEAYNITNFITVMPIKPTSALLEMNKYFQKICIRVPFYCLQNGCSNRRDYYFLTTSLFTSEKGESIHTGETEERSPPDPPWRCLKRERILAGGSVCFYFSVPRGVKLSWVLSVASASRVWEHYRAMLRKAWDQERVATQMDIGIAAGFLDEFFSKCSSSTIPISFWILPKAQ